MHALLYTYGYLETVQGMLDSGGRGSVTQAGLDGL